MLSYMAIELRKCVKSCLVGGKEKHSHRNVEDGLRVAGSYASKLYVQD